MGDGLIERLKAERADGDIAGVPLTELVNPDGPEAASRIAELDGELDAVSAAIGTVRFMDPPDGGDVSLAEQVRRMKAALDEAEAKLATAVGALERIATGYAGCADCVSFVETAEQALAFIQERT